VRLGKPGIQLQCLSRRADRLRARIPSWSAYEGRAEMCVGLCQAHVSRRERWVLRDRVLKIGDNLFNLRTAVVSSELTFEIALVDFRRHMACRHQSRILLSRDRNLDLSRNGLCDIAF